MKTASEKLRDIAKQYGYEFQKPEENNGRQTASDRLRQIAGAYGYDFTTKDNTLSVRKRQEETKTSSSPASSRGETNRSSDKRWQSDLNTNPAPERTMEDIQADIDAVDKRIYEANTTKHRGTLPQNLAHNTQVDAHIAELKKIREQFESEWSSAKTAEYDRLASAEDFADNSSYRSTKTDTSSGVHRPVTAQSGIQSGVTGYGDWVYEYINKNPDISQAVRENRVNELLTANGASAQGYDLSFLEQMHDDEIAKYNYLYSTQGKDAAQEYLDFIQSDPYYRDGSLNKRQREETERNYKKFAVDHPVLASAVTVTQLPATTTAYAGQVIHSVLGEELDPNASYNKSVYTKNAVRDNVTKQVEKRWGKKGSFAYNVGMSMADFLAANALTGGVGASFVLGSGAAAETTLAALERGVDDTGALALGAVAGAAEYFTEKISVERLFSNEWTEHALKYVVKNALSEGGEEFASSVTNLVADILISKDKSEWQQSINAYMEQGFTAQQALDFAYRDQMLSLGLDFLAGAVSGTLMAGAGVAIGKGVQAAGTAAVNRESGRQVQDAYRTAVNNSRMDSELGTFQTDRLYTETPEADAVFKIGSDPEYGQLMTLAEQDKAKAIEAAPDDLTKTTIKYGASREQYNQAKALSKITGKDIVFFEQEGENGTIKNGFYKPSEDRIYLNVRSKNAVPVTVAHELTHTLQSTGGYGDLQDIVFAEMQRTGKDIGKLRAEKAELYAKAGEDLATREKVDQEIVSEFAEEFLDDVSKIREIYREKPSLAKKIARALDRMLIRATGMEDSTAKAFLERASAMYHRVDEIVKNSEEEINRRLDEEEVQAAGTVAQESSAEAVPSPAVKQTVQTTASDEPAVQKPSETAGQRQTAPQTGGTVPGGVSEGAAETDAQKGSETSVARNPAAEELREEAYRAHNNDEIDDQELEERLNLADEMEFTGSDLSRSATVVDYPEGKIQRGVRQFFGAKKKDSGEQYSISEDKDSAKITANMSDTERYRILEGRNVRLTAKTDYQKLSEQYDDLTDIDTLPLKETKKLLQKLGEQFGVFKGYQNADISVEFEYSRSNLKESVQKQGKNYFNFAKMLSCFDDVIDNAVGIEVHNRNGTYKTDETLKDVYVLVSAFDDGKNIVPVKLEVKEFNTHRKKNALYISVALQQIEKDRIVTTADSDTSQKHVAPLSDISITDLFANVNPSDGSFLKYIPDDFLSKEQRDAKTDYIEREKQRNAQEGIRFSISDEGDTTPYGSLPTKAQTRVRDLEYDLGRAMDKMFGLGMTYRSPEFRKWLQDNIRPLVNTYLETGSIPQEESDALFRSFYNPLSGADEDLQKQEFYSAFERMEEGLRNAARWAGAQGVADDAEAPDNPMPTTEEAEELFRAQRDARREMDKVMYKLLLTPQDEVTVGELLRGTKSEDQITENRDDILEAYRVQKAFRDADAAVSVYKKRLKAELYRHVDAYLGNIAQWKDKAVPLLYQRETMERNIRDIIPDKAEADAFIAEFITPVHHAEAERQRFLGEYRDRVRKLGLSAKVQKGNAQSEAYAVQLLGEAQDNVRILSLSGRRDQKRDGHTLAEWQMLIDNFWTENPNMNRAKIERAIGEFRKIYNELLPQINEVRIRNGYAPVAFRQGYFPHFTATSEDTVLAKILRPFGIQFNADALPTAINGLTADFKPGITYFQFGNERLGFETTYNALQGYEMYLNAASDVIFHTDNIQKLRALATRIRYLTGDEGVKQQIDKVRNNDTLDEAEKQVQLEEIYRKGRYRMSNFVIAADEYTNSLANKKSRFDRGVEELFGRPAYSVMKALESRVASNMIAGNIGSALTNVIPLNQANAIIGNVNVLKGMYQTVRGMARDDGFAAASDFLTNRRGSDSLVRTTSQKLSDMASIPMNLIDNFVSESIVRAAYMKNLAGGMGEDLALQHADALAASIMADRSKGALPLLFNARNPLMKLFTQFQVEVNNEYSVIFKDIPELAKADAKTRAGAAARIAGMLFKYLVGAWLFNDLYEKLFGRRAALDPVEMINNAVGGIYGYQVPNVVDLAGEAISGDLTAGDFAVEAQDPGKVLQTLGTEAAESLPFVGGVLGGGRVPIQSALPDLPNLTMAATSDTWTGQKRALTAFEELSKPAAYLLPPFGGGQIQKMLRGGAAALQGGVYGVEGDEDGGTYLKYPVYDDWQDRLNAIVFGTTYTEGGREWVDSGFKSLSVKQTTAYQAMKEFGADDRAAYDLIQAYKAVPDGEGKSAAQRDVIRDSDIPGGAKYAAYYNLGASDTRRALMDAIADTEPEANLGEAAEVLMDISDIRTGKTAGVCDLLAQSDLTEETKTLIYRQEVSDQRDDDIAAAAWAGITFDEYLDAHGAYSAIGKKELSKSEQALEFSRYVDGMNLSDAQKDSVHEIFKYYSQIPVQAKNYNELRDLGISDDYAAKLVRAVDELEPLPGEKSVSAIQKARVVVDTISDADDRLAALGTVLSDSQYRKVSIAADAGLDPEVWVAFREILPEFDSDANGSYTQAEMEDAIRAFSGGSNYGTTLMKAARNLSRDEMAILWQIGGNWKSANNPFSKTTGKKVKDLLDAEKKG